MKQITIHCLLDGTIKVTATDKLFIGEANSTRVVVNYPSEYLGHKKRIDVFVGKTKSPYFFPTDVLEHVTTNQLIVNLPLSVTLGGYLYIQPIAYLTSMFDEESIVKWAESRQVPVEHAVGTMETLNTPDTVQSLFDYIDDTIASYDLDEVPNKQYVDEQDLLKVDKVIGKSLIDDTAITDLTDGGDTELHIHDSRYYTETESNVITNALDTRIDVLENNVEITKEPTGFTNNSAISMSYNPTTRKVTLTGTFEAYYKGVKVDELTDGWVSQAHADVQANYYLYYCDTGFVFSTTPWDFTCLMIAFVQYNSHQIGIRECHGFMPYTVHDELHRTIGAYKRSGGDFSDYTPGSTTATLRRPNISDTYVSDEDLTSLIPALSTKLYTQRYLQGNAVRSFNLDQADIIPLNGNIPYYNQNNGGTWQQTPFSVNAYGAIFVVALPTTSDSQSQKYRYMFVQPQTVSTSLTTIQALTPSSLVHGDSTMLVSEFVFIAKIIVRYTANNWVITSVEKLDGTKISQVATQAGNYLSVVSHDATLTGDGTAGSVLVVANDGHTHDTRYYTETEVDTKDATKSDKLTFTNLLANSDFSNGQTSWLSGFQTVSITGGIATCLANSNSASLYQVTSPIIGHKYYAKVRVKSTSAQVYLQYGSRTSYHSGSNAYENLSLIMTATTTSHWFSVKDTRTSGWDSVYIGYAMLVDLTATFGEGKEPISIIMDNAISYYTNQHFNGASVIDLSVQLSASVASRFNGLTCYCLGDSITAMGYYIDSLSKKAGLTITNYGVSGSKLADTSGTNTNAMCYRHLTMSSTEPNIIIVLGGTNDCGVSTVGTVGDSTVATVAGAVRTIISGLQGKYPNSYIIFATMPRRFDARYDDYANIVANTCAYYNIPCVDLFHRSGITDFNYIKYMLPSDLIHPNPLGGRKIAQLLLNCFEEIIY